MKTAIAGEYSGLVVAALVLLVVLIVSFMCIQLFYLRKPKVTTGGGFTGAEPFVGYSPACGGSQWQGRNRGRCLGLTSGVMPTLEYTNPCMGDLGCGLLGIPP